MKKKILFLGLFMVYSALSAQTIQNGNCEDIMTEYPGFPGNYYTSGWDGVGIQPDIQSFHSGNQSIKLVNVYDPTVQAVLGLSNPEIPAFAYNTYNGQISTPESIEISAWYKFTQVGGDTAVIIASVYDTLGSGYNDDILLFQGGIDIVQSVQNWTNVNIPMIPISLGIPNRFEILVTSSSTGVFNSGVCHPGSTLWIDDFTVSNVGSTSGINDVLLDEINLSVYPNPANDYLNFSSDELIQSISLFAIDGKNVYYQEVLDNKIQINISNLNVGVYYYEITTDKGLTIKNKITKR